MEEKDWDAHGIDHDEEQYINPALMVYYADEHETSFPKSEVLPKKYVIYLEMNVFLLLIKYLINCIICMYVFKKNKMIFSRKEVTC